MAKAAEAKSVERQDASTSEGDDEIQNIVLKDVRKTFQRTGGEVVHAVDGISLRLAKGKMLVLLGPSGCGKTTLLRCIAGLEEPDAGDIWVNGTHVYSESNRRNLAPDKRNLSMMFQSYAIWPHMTVEENVAYPLHARREPRRDIGERVAGALAAVGIPTLGQQYPNQLSGGQQQRVALARSLVVNPTTVLFDEPLSNVDAKVRDELRLELVTRQQEFGFAGVYVTHDQSEALQLADEIAVMEQGRIVQIGTPTEVYSRPANLYVATFVGKMNCLEAAAHDHEAFDGSWRVQVGSHQLTGIPMDVVAGAPAVATIRPEAFQLHITRPSDADNVLEGRVLASMYEGSIRNWVVRGEQFQATVTVPAASDTPHDLPVGTPVWLAASRESVLIYGAA